MFIAMNRFHVRLGREADFEEQWRSRDTYLKGVDGFVAFALLHGQPIPGHGPADSGHEGHDHDAHGHEHDAHTHGHGHDDHSHEAAPGFTEYVSHTTWRDQDAFDAWRTSDVFRLAHAQGSVEGVLMGPPQVALYASVMEEAAEPIAP